MDQVQSSLNVQFHFFGVNMRHLALVGWLSASSMVKLHICCEILTRTLKNLFRQQLRENTDFQSFESLHKMISPLIEDLYVLVKKGVDFFIDKCSELADEIGKRFGLRSFDLFRQTMLTNIYPIVLVVNALKLSGVTIHTELENQCINISYRTYFGSHGGVQHHRAHEVIIEDVEQVKLEKSHLQGFFPIVKKMPFIDYCSSQLALWETVESIKTHPDNVSKHIGTLKEIFQACKTASTRAKSFAPASNVLLDCSVELLKIPKVYDDFSFISTIVFGCASALTENNDFMKVYRLGAFVRTHFMDPAVMGQLPINADVFFNPFPDTSDFQVFMWWYAKHLCLSYWQGWPSDGYSEMFFNKLLKNGILKLLDSKNGNQKGFEQMLWLLLLLRSTASGLEYLGEDDMDRLKNVDDPLKRCLFLRFFKTANEGRIQHLHPGSLESDAYQFLKTSPKQVLSVNVPRILKFLIFPATFSNELVVLCLMMGHRFQSQLRYDSWVVDLFRFYEQEGLVDLSPLIAPTLTWYVNLIIFSKV
jgi:hypothetical protein